MLTSAAARGLPATRFQRSVRALAELVGDGESYSSVAAQVRAGRRQRIGRAVLLHNGTPSPAELRQIALVNCGPRSVLTAFSSLEEDGLVGWSRPAVHVLVPRGARIVRPDGLTMRVHYTDDWQAVAMHPIRRLHRPGPAALLAASTFERPRSAVGVLAAVAQQQLVRPDALIDVVESATRVRHRRILLAAAHDIAQGAQALSEIDLARTCRAAGLPEPVRQAVRKEPSGRRRYLDAEWRLPSGRRLVVEVDGALHLAAARWWADQLRQNELVLTGDFVLRFPSVIFRCEQALMINQLSRALLLR